MQPFVLSLRAVGANLAMRLYIPATIIAGIIMILIVGAGLWLTSISSWWLLLLIPIVVIFSIITAIAVVVLMLIRYVRPQQTPKQKKAVANFVDKLQGISDIAGTSKLVLLFRVIRSIAAPRKNTYLADLAKNKYLANDFRELQKLFTV